MCVRTSLLHYFHTFLHKAGDGGVFSVTECVQVAAKHVI